MREGLRLFVNTAMHRGKIRPGDRIRPDSRPDSLRRFLRDEDGALIYFGLILLVLVRAGGLRRPGLAFGVFLAGYGLARMFVELFRVADAQFITPDNPLGHVLGGPVIGLTMGQTLSLPMVLIGLALVAYARRRPPVAA